ncbi:ARM repeat-containing protein [Aureobasidium pullulans]|uniref:ARM repeat-containing protein n=1 Tax=Aureobasidium pullulans TaxID=5580 RepID=A0A4S8X5T6_AURPU|nr:ARM repeat-containing protein [Aureobasidium pullulans]THX34812.1 ARM repeat-containing protein [Aureobasidium pullulans]THX49905.1 ARM repeat-containing protein [Aureobasidium pullulans]
MERQRKRELRDLNQRAWAGEPNVLAVQGSLDSSMKKNTAFIKRLRTAINAAGQSVFLQEICTLSLHKYLSEIISACFEGLTKLKTPGEIAAGVEIVSALHQRFGPDEFTKMLGWFVGRGLATPDRAQLKALAQDVREREEKERISRQRILLRVATELWLVGVLRSLEDIARPEEANKLKESGKPVDTLPKAKTTRPDTADPEPFPLEVLKDMLGHDREHVNLPLVVIFVKSFAWDILASKPTQDGRKTVAEDGSTVTAAEETDADSNGTQDPPLCASDMQQRFKNILGRYFQDVKAHIVRDQKHLTAQGRRNAEAYVKSGEVFEDRQTNFEKQTKSHEKLVSNAQVLADALGVDMPDLSEKESNNAGGDGGIGLVKTGEYLRGQGDGAGIWEDEEERRFYENLIDLKDRVPGILLEDGKKKKSDGDDQVGKRVEDIAEAKLEAAEPKSAEGDDQSTAIANKTVGAQVDALLAQLVDLTNKDQVDQFAIDFCFLNSKASRNRLVRAIQDIPKGRTDLLPLYSRLVATLGKHLIDVPQALIAYLDEEFRSLQRRKSKDFLGQVRMINIRYIAELTKFGVVPEHVIFHCLKVSLDDFSRMNIEIISNLLENCGRYLLRNPDTSPRMASFLETLQRKKGAQHLGQQERMLIENAMYYVNPPERAAIQQKERTPLELYVRKLIYLDLSKRSLEKVIKQIRKLHWEEPEVPELLRKIFTKPGKIKYSNVHLLAVILGALHRYHQSFTVSVLDDVLEQITVGLETNDFKQNQKRIAEVKYLGELYVYRMVDSALIFDTLYHIINYGHPGGFARPGAYNMLDLPDDYFRIRLVASLLETCGMYFDKGAVKKKLDFFLSFFQYYIQTKEPMPMDVEFVVQDMFALLRPQWKVATTFEEAQQVFSEAVKHNYQNSGSNKQQAEQEEEEEEDGRGIDDVNNDDGEDDKSSGDESAEPTDDEGAGETPEEGTEDEEEHIVVTRPEDQRDPEADAEFDRELAKMMAESVESRKFDRKPVFDVPLPMRKTATATSTPNSEPAQPTRSIDLPSDSNFAVAMRSQQEQARAEQQRIKNLVLNYDLRDDDPNDGESSFHYIMQPNTNRTVLVGKGALNRQQLPRDFNNPAAANASHIPRTSSHGNINIARGLSLHTPPPPSAISSSYAVITRNENFKPRASPATPNADHASFTPTAALDAQSPYNQPRVDKSGTSRNVTRSRKLQLSDVDWYETPPNTPVASKQKEKPETRLSLDSYVVIGRKQKKAPKKKEPDALGNA